MSLKERVVAPRSGKGRRALEQRESKTVENEKRVLFLKGSRCPSELSRAMHDLAALKQGQTTFYTKKNPIRPFEDVLPLEKMCRKEDTSLFVFGNSTKKRPNTLILGRMFDHHLLDMFELRMDEFRALQDFKNEKVGANCKPVLVFNGDAFEASENMQRLQNLLIDFFRGPVVNNVRLAGIEHVVHFVAENEQQIVIRNYRATLLKSSSPTLPRVELTEMGPYLRLNLDRSHLASSDLYGQACRQQKNVNKVKKVKNLETDVFGSVLGKLHVPPQDVDALQTRKMRGLKEARRSNREDEKESRRKRDIQAVFNEDNDGNDHEEQKGEDDEEQKGDCDEEQKGDCDEEQKGESDEVNVEEESNEEKNSKKIKTRGQRAKRARRS